MSSSLRESGAAWARFRPVGGRCQPGD